MNKDQVRKLYKTSNYSIRLAEAIDREIKEKGFSYVEELKEIKANLHLLLRNEESMKDVFGTEWKDLTLLEESDIGDTTTSSTYEGKVTEIQANLQLLLGNEESMKDEFGTEWKDLTLPEESDIGDSTTSSTYEGKIAETQANLQLLLGNEESMKDEFGTEWKDLTLPEESDIGDSTASNTYEGKVAEILRTCRNNLAILRTTSTTTSAEDQIVVLESIIQNHKNIIVRVQNLLTKFTQHQGSDNISSEETHDSDDDLPCTYEEEILDQLEQENPELFDIMYASPFSPDLQQDEDAVASSGYQLSIMTKLLSESKKEPIENKKLVIDDEEDVEGLDDEHTIRNMMKLERESQTFISSPKGDGLRRESFIYLVDTGNDFHFRKNTVYVAMLTLHKFLQVRILSKKRLKLLRYACLCLAVKMNQRMYKEVKALLNDFKSRGINGESFGRMELSILKALDWDIHVVTPFFFTAFFLSRLCAHYALADSRKEDIRIKSDKIILNVVEEGNLLKYDPSQIAVGAILLAMDDTLTVEDFEALSVDDDLSIEEFFNIVDLFKCYDKLRDLMKGPIYFSL